MKKASIETAVGIFMVIGIACVGYLTIKLGQMELMGGNYYSVYAGFQSVTGLKSGAQVEMAGVPIGRVETIALDHERQEARVELKIEKGVELSDDVIASVKTSGLIGDKYIMLTPGSGMAFLEPGGKIIETESAIDIEALISKYVFGSMD
ncbi:MAG: outer membrane lipid asymmetry maintenance protein MlaD [Desulfobacterales bacterium]|nr:outer membrane lipid asymmetry maintenance protein MlaD [Desulfobacterales bacterium]